ncbi:hypothetical protein BROUX41_002487 [Berkeleyomyces rouxiae]|uniref:uncharacterized protein n=1 Tax=Berkeleyomyces rouxiae TaxID=2035830 RepID=UPI003B7AB3F2
MDRSSTNTPTPSESSSTLSHASDVPSASLAHPQPGSGAAANPLPPLSRDYPAPHGTINVAEALARPPLRWTIRGTMAAGEHRQVRVKTAEEKARDFAQAKADLLEASASLKKLPASGSRRPSS